MRKLFLAILLVPCVTVLAGCPKKKDDSGDSTDAEAEAATPLATNAIDATVPPVPPTATNATNAAAVARFPVGEKALADDDQKTVDLFAQARTGPKQGAVVALVRAGTDPFKIAEFQDSILVTFPDPKVPTGTLMGWIAKDAFVRDASPSDAGAKDASKDATVSAADAAAAAPATALKCPASQEAVDHIAPTTVCRKRCTTDKDCKGQSAGACANARTNKGKVTRVCAADEP